MFSISTEQLFRRFYGKDAHIHYCRQLSVVLEHQGEILGTCLFLPKSEDGTSLLFAVIVHPRWRRGWVTPNLKLGAFKNADTHGVASILFQALDNQPDTLNHAARVGASRLVD